MMCERCDKELGDDWPYPCDHEFLEHVMNPMVCVEEVLCIDCQRKFMKDKKP